MKQPEASPGNHRPAPTRHGGGNQPTARRPSPETGHRLLRRLLHRLGDPPLGIELEGGAAAANPDPVARIRIRDRGTLFRLALNGAIEFGDAYSDGRLEVDGDLDGMLEEIYRRAPPPSEAPVGGARWLARSQRGRSNSLRAAMVAPHRPHRK